MEALTTTKLADEINRLHDGIVGALQNTVTDAIEIGRLLTEQKNSLAHGEWLPWLKENIEFAERTAQEYMGFYEHRDRLKSAQCADFASARKLLRDSNPKKPNTPKVHEAPIIEAELVVVPPVQEEADSQAPTPAKAQDYVEEFRRFLQEIPAGNRAEAEQAIWNYLSKSRIQAPAPKPAKDKETYLLAESLAFPGMEELAPRWQVNENGKPCNENGKELKDPNKPPKLAKNAAPAKTAKVVTIDDGKRKEKENAANVIAMALALSKPAPAPATPARVKPATNGHRYGHAFSSLHIKQGEYGAQQVSANKFVAGYRRNRDTQWILVGEYRGMQSAMNAAEQALLLAGGKS
jgi:hypothetical protein